MLHVVGSTIKLTRGDTAYLEVPIMQRNPDGTVTPYVMQPTDTLTFSMKRAIYNCEPCLQKTLVGTNIFHIEPCDTQQFEFADYTYDVRLKDASGDVYTVIETSPFTILQEVGT